MRAMTVTVVVSLALVVAIGGGCGWYSREISEQLQMKAEEIAAAAEESAWEEAQERIRAAEAEWRRQSDRLALWVNHADLEEVDLCFSRLRTAIWEENRYFSLLYAAELNEALELIYFRDAFSLKNIL